MTTREFLGYFPGFCIQTFHDSVTNRNDYLTTCGKPSAYTKELLRDYNAKGAGIFFTPNSFPSGKRTKSNCTKINAWFVENDTLSIDEQYKNLAGAPLPPSFIVQSKKSLHAYWLADNATFDNFLLVQQGLIKHFEGDAACKDVSRVLRIPGFNHNKAEPFLVGLVDEHPERVYAEAEMLSFFPYTEPERKEYKKEFSNINIGFWEALGSLDNRTVLLCLSQSPIIKNETISFKPRNPEGEYILINGAMCDAWIDGNGMIGSGKRGGPTWIQWLEYYGWSKRDIAVWAKDHLHHLLPAHVLEKAKAITEIQITKATSHAEEIEALFTTAVSPYTWGTRVLDKNLPTIEQGHYILLFGQQGSGKTNFALFIAKKNSELMGGIVFLSLEMSKKQLLKRYVLNRAGVGKEQYRNRNFDPKIAHKYLPEIENIIFVGIDEGETYGLKEIEMLVAQTKCKLLIVDNLNKVQGSGRSENELTQAVSQGILNITRKTNIPIIMIHHANKPSQEKTESNIRFRGMSGMRGTNKTADDADIILEVARPSVEGMLDPSLKNVTAISVYKDREFDSRGTMRIQYQDGQYVDDYMEELAGDIGGTVIRS